MFEAAVWRSYLSVVMTAQQSMSRFSNHGRFAEGFQAASQFGESGDF
jgi:hypothetical protein